MVCPDDNLGAVRELGINASVLGIRQAKGLEFTDVVIVNFFSSISSIDQKAWKVLLNESLADKTKASHPQVKTQLKLLYTAPQLHAALTDLFLSRQTVQLYEKCFLAGLRASN